MFHVHRTGWKATKLLLLVLLFCYKSTLACAGELDQAYFHVFLETVNTGNQKKKKTSTFGMPCHVAAIENLIIWHHTLCLNHKKNELAHG